MIGTARAVQRIPVQEVRDLAAYALDYGVHYWRCQYVSTDECFAVAVAFSEEDTIVSRVLRPVMREYVAYYVLQPIRSLLPSPAWPEDEED